MLTPAGEDAEFLVDEQSPDQIEAKLNAIAQGQFDLPRIGATAVERVANSFDNSYWNERLLDLITAAGDRGQDKGF